MNIDKTVFSMMIILLTLTGLSFIIGAFMLPHDNPSQKINPFFHVKVVLLEGDNIYRIILISIGITTFLVLFNAIIPEKKKKKGEGQ